MRAKEIAGPSLLLRMTASEVIGKGPTDRAFSTNYFKGHPEQSVRTRFCLVPELAVLSTN